MRSQLQPFEVAVQNDWSAKDLVGHVAGAAKTLGSEQERFRHFSIWCIRCHPMPLYDIPIYSHGALSDVSDDIQLIHSNHSRFYIEDITRRSNLSGCRLYKGWLQGVSYLVPVLRTLKEVHGAYWVLNKLPMHIPRGVWPFTLATRFPFSSR